MADSVMWESFYKSLTLYKATTTYDNHYRDLNPNNCLRLSGGRACEDNDPLSPTLACKDILDQFDSIIREYKNALGPCGQSVCPFSPNLAEKACKKDWIELTPKKISVTSCADLDCPFSLPKSKGLSNNFESIDESVPLNYCGVVDCPFAQRNTLRKDHQVQAACGSARCAFTKFRLGLVDKEAVEEVGQVPPPTSGFCGKPKCKFPVIGPSLPPIHWDCPEPLPSEPCKNPYCPYLPADLRALQALVRKGPCGSPSCTHIINSEREPQRSSPDCPPYEEDDCEPKCESKKQNNVCENPDCPFQSNGVAADSFLANSPEDAEYKGTFVVCKNPNCPFMEPKDDPQDGEYCGNPNCPFAPKQNSKNAKKSTCDDDIPSVCSVPDCPYNKIHQKNNRNYSCSPGNVCDDPECPFAKANSADYSCKNPCNETSACDNPDCQFAKQNSCKNSKNACENPNCPFAKKDLGTGNACDSSDDEDDASFCGNPDCPFAKKANQNPCEDIPSVCSNPDCPFAKKPSEECEEIKDVCDNPDCPFAKKREETSMKSPCEEPANVCGNPECPFNQQSADIVCKLPCDEGNVCENPDCPFQQLIVKTPCGNPDCPYSMEDTYVCRVPCSADQVCDNPDCPWQEDTTVVVLEESPRKGSKESEGKRSFGRTDSSKKDVAMSASRIMSAEETAKMKEASMKKLLKKDLALNTSHMVGHRDCLTPIFHVPKNMGWLWNLYDPMSCRDRRGFKPGAVDRKVAKMIRKHKRQKALEKKGSDAFVAEKKQTITVSKKEGEYIVTVNPLKDPKDLRSRNESVYMDCTPMQFKIKKHRNLDYQTCVCDEESESSTSSDGLEIMFSPTAAKKNPAFFVRKKAGKCVDTQYDKKDVPKEDAKGKGKKDKKGKKGGKGKKKK